MGLQSAHSGTGKAASSDGANHLIIFINCLINLKFILFNNISSNEMGNRKNVDMQYYFVFLTFNINWKGR